MYVFFEKVWEVAFFTFLRDIVKPAISVWNLMFQNKDWCKFRPLEFIWLWNVLDSSNKRIQTDRP